jgi:hypothetical protein
MAGKYLRSKELAKEGSEFNWDRESRRGKI